MRGLVRSLYENYIRNVLTSDEYFAYKQKYETGIERLSEEIVQLESGLSTIEKQIAQYKELKQDAANIRGNHELTAALIERLIDRVEVTGDNQITVCYRFRSEFQNCEEVLNLCRNI